MQAKRPQKVPTIEKLEWQAPLQVVKYPDPRLRAPNARIGVFDDSLRELAKQMFEVMYQDDGVGLAAPQVGVNARLMVFNETAEPGSAEEMVLVNPVILEKGRATDVDVEGCLSFPTIYADVERATKIEVQYQDLDGKAQQMQLRDFVARVFQHEYDHLQGVLYHDRMKSAELEKVRPELVALEEAFIAAHPGVPIQRVPPPAAAKAKGFGSVARR
ncbi:peptide deformylase [Scenedesmus sp. NREL 46B-D3]|nr:peptide deformylase [Scenedesmus sp. NREL 46B-D3]